ncbi:MAG TPA: hypothetical protein VFU27_13905 [Terriglobales bacterium]|nr:hypothetical protein [Terriglobales bacterium]
MSLGASLTLLLAAFVLPWEPIQRILEERTHILPALRALARHRNCAILLVAAVAFGGDALVSLWRPPLPVVPDEFSYLLAADTFASGRLTNPTPALWQRFETPEVLFRPTYQSKYPPGQALFLAAGELLAGKPAIGVWLSSALACAALCWMLQAWVGETWALYGALLAAFQFAFFGHWAQSYWGGMVAALGGALLYGAVRRIADPEAGTARARDAFWLALGLVILANTRPFEGLLAAVAALGGLVLHSLRHRSAGRALGRKLLLPAALVLLLGASLTVFYNRRVTGSAWRLPYQIYEQQYDPVPSFIFQPLRPWPHLENAAMEAAAVDTLSAWRWAHGFFSLAFVASKLFGLWQFVFAAALSLPFIMLTWAERWPRSVQALQAGAFLVIQVLALRHSLFWPSPHTLWIVILLLVFLIQAALLVRFFRNFWDRLALAALGLVAVGLALETWRFHSHYVAPVVPLAIVLAVQAVRRAWAWAPLGRAPGKVLALGLPVLILGVAAAGSASPSGQLERWARQRAAMQQNLESLPGWQLVIVHYGPGHDSYEEWVVNRSDLRKAKVLWAREGSREQDCGLIAAYAGRTVWLLDADRNQLRKFPDTCAGGKTAPGSSVPVLESLPDR